MCSETDVNMKRTSNHVVSRSIEPIQNVTGPPANLTEESVHHLTASNSFEQPKRRKLSKLRKKYGRELQDLWDWRPIQCCARCCALQLGVERCRFLRKDFLEASQNKRKEMLLDFRVGVVDNAASELRVDGIRVCTKFLKSVLNVSSTLRSNVLGLPSASSSHLPGRMGGGATSESKQIGVIAFLNDLVEQVGDCMPHVSERHLPHKCKKLVYFLYYDNQVTHRRKSASSSMFYHIWKQFLPHIKCIRSHTFETCDTCITFRDNQRLMIAGKLVGRTKASVISSFHRHIHDVKIQRAEYRRVRQMAGERPGEVVSVIIDGADQAKFALPRFVDKSKNEKGNALKQKVTGVLFHHGLGAADFFCAFTSRENIPGGANQTIDVFVRGLLALIKRRALRDSFCTYAKELFVQLDNTPKDNKNRYFFAFCDHLVFLCIFKRVTINFLPVGHTHEDIDRKFSRLSVKLKQQDTITVSELHDAIRTSERWMIQPFVARVKGCLNYSGCLTEQSCVVREKTGISTYRKFVFERGAVCNTRDGQRYTVVCKAGFSMTTPDHEMKLFSTSKGNVGYFLTREPDINRIPPTALKIVSIQDADKYRARIRYTENRIRSHEKAQSLLREIDNLQFTTEMRSEWNFCELEGLQGAAEECDDMSEEGVPDGLSYEVGEMVTVRTSGELNSATPFWLGCIVDVQTSSHCSNRLTVRWYLLTLSKRGTQRDLISALKGNTCPVKKTRTARMTKFPLRACCVLLKVFQGKDVFP